MTGYTVVRMSSVDIGQSTPVAEYAVLVEAVQYITEHTVDGCNVSDQDDCDYLVMGGEDE